MEKSILCLEEVKVIYPGRRIRTRTGRNGPEFTGSWKQYSRPEITGIFRSLSCCIQPETAGTLPEKSSYFPLGNLFLETAGYDRFPGDYRLRVRYVIRGRRRTVGNYRIWLVHSEFRMHKIKFIFWVFLDLAKTIYRGRVLPLADSLRILKIFLKLFSKY